MPIDWRELTRDEWQAALQSLILRIVLQAESPEDEWAWAVATDGEEAPIAAGYEVSLEAARESAERAAVSAVRAPGDDAAMR